MSAELPPFPDARPSLPPQARRVPVASALRRVLHKGYGRADLRADLMAGTVVGVVALPLSMALSIAVGAPPQHGLVTAVIAGATVALLGGCKFQVTGPTAAFVVVLGPIYVRHGLPGLLTAGLMAGVLLVAMGFARMGNLIRFIPYPVTTGFTTGIAAVIALLQLKDVFGLRIPRTPEQTVERVVALWHARGTLRLSELAIASFTLALLLLFPRFVKRVPAPLVAIVAGALAAALLHALSPTLAVETIGTRFRSIVHGVEIAGIPSGFPWPALPWGHAPISFAMIRELLPAAFAIAMLGAIESLLSAVIADGMTSTTHDPNAELVALGAGNLLAPLFGGIAATGALARTATNVRAGARSPLAAVVHSLVVLSAMLALSPLVSYIPMASLAALLLVVAWNMSELRNFVGVVRVAPKSDVVVLVVCFLLTVFFDMVIAVSIGFVLAAILFMRRMSELTESRLLFHTVAGRPGDESAEQGEHPPLPKGVLVYEINGPLFFGAAQKAMSALSATSPSGFRLLLIHLGRVPVIDATGLAALENTIATVLRSRRAVVLAGPLPRPHQIFDKAKLESKHPGLRIAKDLPSACALAHDLLEPAATP